MMHLVALLLVFCHFCYGNDDFFKDDSVILEEERSVVNDPFEKINRVNFAILFGIDKMVLKPLSEMYDKLPDNTGLSLAGGSKWLSEPIYFTNHVMAADKVGMATSFGRFITNTFGVFGLIDIADLFDIYQKPRTFAEVARRYGVPEGPYIVTPISIGTSLDFLSSVQGMVITNPTTPDFLQDTKYNFFRVSFSILPERVSRAGMIEMAAKSSPDMYITVRSFMLSGLEKKRKDSKVTSSN